MRKSSLGWLVLPLLLLALPVAAQIPDTFENLQVLDAEIDKRELIGVMRSFAGALGVRCAHCHDGPDNLQGMDFATDEIAAKRTAREMLRMVEAINGKHLAEVETSVEVQCATCHRGVASPTPIDEIVARRIEQEGVEAAIAHWRELRAEHYGSAAYDFSPLPLNRLAERLGADDASPAILALNIEHHPDDGYTRMVAAGVHRARGETELAIAALRKAIEIDPDNGWAARQLAALEATDPAPSP